MPCCGHVQFGWFARSSSQLIDGVDYVVAHEFAQEHQRPRDGLVKLDARRV